MPPGYSARSIYHSRLSGLSRITMSELGDIFVGQGLEGGGYRVSLLDVEAAELGSVIDVPEGTSSVIFGGPGHTVFVPIGSEILAVDPFGPHQVWGLIAPGTAPWYWTADGRMLAIAVDPGGDGQILELAADGSATLVAGGFESPYDVVGDGSGRCFVADLTAATVSRIDGDGTVSVLITTPPDNTDLALDAAGRLYAAAAGFLVRIDTSTGAQTSITEPGSECPSIKVPSDFVITAADRAYFASWVEATITWYDLVTGDRNGAYLVDDMFANTSAVDLGPDGALYLAVNGCSDGSPTRVVRYDATGAGQIFVDSISGSIADIAFAPSGELFAVIATTSSSGLYSIQTTQTLVPGSDSFEYESLVVDPGTDHLFAVVGGEAVTATMTVVEFDAGGLVASTDVSTPKTPMGMHLDITTGGTLLAQASEMERFTTGPEVDRWILELDLGTASSTVLAQVNRVGCCPLNAFSVDSVDTAWWILNPDFLLYRITDAGGTTLFADSTPIDAASVHHVPGTGHFLTTPEGLLLIEPPLFADGFESGSTSAWSSAVP